MTLQQRVEEVNTAIRAMSAEGTLTKRVLAIGIEINQRYTEYLDALLESDLSVPQGITINVDGQKIHFDCQSDFENWLAGLDLK